MRGAAAGSQLLVHLAPWARRMAARCSVDWLHRFGMAMDFLDVHCVAVLYLLIKGFGRSYCRMRSTSPSTGRDLSPFIVAMFAAGVALLFNLFMVVVAFVAIVATVP